MESHFRSIIKAITWRAGATVITFGVAWILTQKFDMAAKIGVLDTTIKLGAFYLHERAWTRITFGQQKPPEYQI